MDFLAILSICSTNTISINIKELEYILSRSVQNYSQRIKEFQTNSFNEVKYSFPIYEEDFHNHDKVIEFFEECGFIYLKDQNICFTHPNYYEAGQYLFSTKSSIKQNRYLACLKRAMFCLDPESAFFATSKLGFLFNNVTNDFEKIIIELIFLAQKSIFPSVINASTQLLLQLYSNLNEEDKQIVLRVVQHGDKDINDIIWHNESLPYIPEEINIIDSYVQNLSTPDNIVSIVEEKINNFHYISSYLAWKYIIYWKNNIDYLPSLSIIKRLLTYKEEFIRTKTARFFLSRFNRFTDYEILKIIFNDSHPSVILDAIKGCFVGWVTFDNETKERLYSIIINSLSNQMISIRLSNFLFTFSNKEINESIDFDNQNNDQLCEIWTFWIKLLSKTLHNFPICLNYNPIRLVESLEKCLEHVAIDDKQEVFSIWYSWIDHCLCNSRIPGEYELAIMDVLLNHNNSANDQRKILFNKLINHPKTALVLTSLKWLDYHWNNLTELENKLLLDLLNTDRLDINWIKACFLTREKTPKHIIKFITGTDTLFEEIIENAFKILDKDKDLLLKSLEIFMGSPGLLWQLAVHHRNTDFWYSIIEYILINHIEPYFDVCLQYFIGNVINSSHEKYSDYKIIWEDVCKNLSKIDVILHQLIYNLIDCAYVYKTTKVLFSLIIRVYEQLDKAEYLKKQIFDYILLLGNDKDFFKIFDKDFFIENIYKDTFDSIILKLFTMDLDKEMIIDIAYKGVERISLLITIHAIDNQKENVSSQSKEKIVKIHDSYFQRVEFRKNEFRKNQNKEPCDWIH